MSSNRPRILLVGMGGLGCPAAWVLAQEGTCELVLMDEDVVDESNLGRQVLYQDKDVGRGKLQAAADALHQLGQPAGSLHLLEERLLPSNARQRVSEVDLVLEGADNYATKFLAADACFLEGKPVVHGAALRWTATVWAVSPRGGPCYRCLFEAPPQQPALSCDSAGVMGPVTGLAGAWMADRALAIAAGQEPYGRLFSYDGRSDLQRQVAVPGRKDCALCGASPSILEVEEALYLGQNCAA